jgi:hypothetical protein
MKKSSGNKNKRISLHISKSKIKAFIICVGLSFVTQIFLNIIYGDYDVEKHKISSVADAEWKQSEQLRKSTEDREKWCKENPPREDENSNTFVSVKRILSGCDESTYIRGVYIPSKNYLNNGDNKVYPKIYSDYDLYVKRITFNPFYGKKYYKKYAGEKFIYADYRMGRNQWNSAAKGEYILMCSLYNLHFTLFFGFILFIVVLGIKFLINNFQLKLKP